MFQLRDVKTLEFILKKSTLSNKLKDEKNYKRY